MSRAGPLFISSTLPILSVGLDRSRGDGAGIWVEFQRVVEPSSLCAWHQVAAMALGTWCLVLGALQNIPLRTPQHSCPLKILIDQFIRNKRPTLYIYSTSFPQVLAVLSFEKLKQLLSRFTEEEKPRSSNQICQYFPKGP